jgi:hypothetical protein
MVLKLITKSERLLSAQNVRPFFISKRDKGTPKEMKRPMKQLFFKAILRNEMAVIEDKTRTEGERST